MVVCMTSIDRCTPPVLARIRLYIFLLLPVTWSISARIYAGASGNSKMLPRYLLTIALAVRARCWYGVGAVLCRFPN